MSSEMSRWRSGGVLCAADGEAAARGAPASLHAWLAFFAAAFATAENGCAELGSAVRGIEREPTASSAFFFARAFPLAGCVRCSGGRIDRPSAGVP